MVFSKFVVDSSSEWQMSGYTRAVQIFQGDHILGMFKVFIHKIFFLLWLVYSVLKGRQSKIWIDEMILSNYRYNVSQFVDMNQVLPILSSWSSVRAIKRPANSVEQGVESLIESRFASYRYWKLAIFLLNPKKIIVKDNLFENSSLLLAAKLMGVQIIGVSMDLFHSGIEVY